MLFDIPAVSSLLFLVAAFALSLVCSLGGVSGAFLLLPLQVLVLGQAGPGVSATNQIFNLLATPSGVWRYVREGRMVWPLALILCAGTLPGIVIGVWLRITLLPDAATFSIFAAAVLLYIASTLGLANLRGTGRKGPQSGANRDFRVHVCSLSLQELRYSFAGTTFTCSVPALVILSLVIGIVGGTYGIGGGAIMAPILVSRFRLPLHTLASATLFTTFFTAVTATACYSFLAASCPHLAVSPDWSLGLTLGLGGMAGMYCGACLQRRLSGNLLNWLLFVLVVAAALALLARAL